MMYSRHLRGLHYDFYRRQPNTLLCRLIITLTEQKGFIPFSTGSTNWYVSLSNTAISRVTLINNLRAHSGDFIPQHDWMKDGWGHTTVNFYKDGNLNIVKTVIWLWTTAMENNANHSIINTIISCYLCMRCLVLSSNHSFCTMICYFLHSDKILFYSSTSLCFQVWSCHSTLAQCGTV